MRSGRALLLTATVCFGTLAFFAKVALDAGTQPFTFLTGRFAIATTVLLVVVRATHRRVRGRHVLIALALGAFAYAGESIALTFALTKGSASIVAVLFGTYPAIVVVLVVLTSEWAHTRAIQLVSLGGVLGGVALILGLQTGASITTAGAILAVVAAACFATFIVAADRLAPTMDALVLAAFACVGAMFSVVVVAAATGDIGVPNNARSWLAIAGAGLISTAAAFLAMFAAIPRAGPVTTGIILGAEPVVTVLLGTVVLGDHLSPTQGLGIVVVIMSVVLLSAVGARPADAMAKD